jgi:hypothetical protein
MLSGLAILGISRLTPFLPRGSALTKESTIDPADLKEFLDYDAETGMLTWKRRDRKWFPSNRAFGMWNSTHPGKEAFTYVDVNGYQRGSVLGKSLSKHRLVWAIYYGKWPDKHIDHIDGVRTNNRIENLRNVSLQDNSKNAKRDIRNTSGQTGVSFYKITNRWRAMVRSKEGKDVSLGYFRNKDDAIAARKAAEIAHGYHPNHGRVD